MFQRETYHLAPNCKLGEKGFYLSFKHIITIINTQAGYFLRPLVQGEYLMG